MDAGTARLSHGRRQGAPDGPVAGREEAGYVDFGHLRVWSHRPATDIDDVKAGDVYWEVGSHYWRPTASEPYVQVPLMRHDGTSIVWGSPLWMLSALCGVTRSEGVAEELVRGTRTQRYALTINVARAQSRGDVPLSLPALDAAEFGAHAWLDGDGVVRRVSGAWPTRSSRIVGGRRQTWVQTEFWDFGVPVNGLDRPST
jgi:hypothetical protein